MYSKNTIMFLKSLFNIGAIKIDTKKGFRLALHDKNPTAPLSPFYLNLRTPSNPKPGSLQPTHVATIATEMDRVVEKAGWKFDCIAGIPRAGTPFAEAFFDVRASLGRKTRIIRMKKSSKDSRALRVDSDYVIRDGGERRSRVLLIDDLITKADTKWIAINALRRGGYEVAGIVVYVDREQGGLEALRESGIPIIAVLKFSDMLKAYHEMEMISAGELATIKDYLRR